MNMLKQFDFMKMIKDNKAAVIVGAIFSLIIGILCLISPFAFGAVLVWVMIALAGIVGICAIIKFIVPGKGKERNPSALALGIVAVLCVTGLILIGLLGKSQVIKGETYSSMEMTTIRLLGFFSVFFGVLSTVNNIFLLCTINNVEPEMKGFMIARAIVGIIVGVLMVVFPFVMFTVSVIIGGVYLIVASIFLFVTLAQVSKKEKTDNE